MATSPEPRDSRSLIFKIFFRRRHNPTSSRIYRRRQIVFKVFSLATTVIILFELRGKSKISFTLRFELLFLKKC